MHTVTLGRTGIAANKNGFGALPIQRVSHQEAAHLLLQALDGGMTFFDTARFYTDSEEKIGLALSQRRQAFCLATKTTATTADAFWSDLETSLRLLKTDYIDVYQFHNPAFCPQPGDDSGLYEAMLAAKQQGKIRFIGMTNHRLSVAQAAVDSGLYDTLQFPFSYLATEHEHAIVQACRQAGVGFIAMKALSGGLISNAAAAYAWLAQYDHVLPIWGVQRQSELDDFLRFVHSPPPLDDDLRAVIDRDRAQLLGNFCRGCGYCMPCPVGIEINNCARMSLMIRRAPKQAQLTPEMQQKMAKIDDCIHCNKCAEQCPYGLDTPKLLADNYADYKEILAGKPL